MNTAAPDNPYKRWNFALFRLVRRGIPWTADDFAEAIDIIGRVPRPNSTASLSELQASRLPQTLTQIVRAFEGSSLPVQAKSTLITGLWESSQALVAGFEAGLYAVFVIAGIQSDMSPDFLRTVLLTARSQRIEVITERLEGYFAIKIRQAIKERDVNHLELAFQRASASDVSFQVFHWGLFAKEAGDIEDEYIFEQLWLRSTGNRAIFNEQAWVSFSNAAGQVQREDLSDNILDEWLPHRSEYNGKVWGSFANAASKVHSTALTHKVWNLSASEMKHFLPETWGAYAKAAARAEDAELLWEIWRSFKQSDVCLTSATAGGFSYAAGTVANGALLEEIWTLCRSSNVSLDSLAWGSLAYGAGHSYRPDLLNAIYDAWDPDPTVVRLQEHLAWGTFLAMALLCGHETLLLRIFRRLASMFDPIRFQNWGAISVGLWNLLHRLRNREIAEEISETLSGYRLNCSRCFALLATESPSRPEDEYRPFEGAGRCLMRWLINSYFRCGTDDYRARLSYIVDGLMALGEKQSEAWIQLICRGQGSYFGCLRAAYQKCYSTQFSFVESLENSQLFDAIRTGQITGEIIRFEREGLYQVAIPRSIPDLPRDAEANRLRPLVDYIWENQRTFITEKKRGDVEQFFAGARKLFDAANTSEFSRADWIHSLDLLLNTIAHRMWDTILALAPDNIHNLKNTFYKMFEKPLNEASIEDSHVSDVLDSARGFIADLGNILGRYRFGETISVSIASLVKAKLLTGRRTGDITSHVTTPFYVTAWEGARNDIIIPMLQEIRFNAERALGTLSPDLQVYRVSLRAGADDEANFGILEVSNSYGEIAEHRISTGYGQRQIQKFADALGGGAVPTKWNEQGHQMFTWKIYLPLWNGTAKETNG